MALLSGLLGNPNNGFLTQAGLLGTPTGDPLAQSLDPMYYNAGDDRASRISQALHQLSTDFANPPQGGGDLAVLSNVANNLGPAYKKNDYINDAVARQTKANDLWAAQHEKEQTQQEDLAYADLIAQHPEWAGMGRKELQKLFADITAQKEGVLGGGGADFSQGNMIEIGVWEDGTTKYGQWQPSYKKGVPPRIEEMPHGFVPFTSAEGKGKAAGAVEDAKTFSQKKADAKGIEEGALRAQDQVQDILNDPNMQYYTGYTGIFGKDVFKMPQYIGFEAKIAPLIAFQFKAFMNESGVHSQISNEDRDAMSALVGKIVPGMPEAQLKQVLTELNTYFAKVRAGNQQYLAATPDQRGTGGATSPDTSTKTKEELRKLYGGGG